MLNQDIEMFNKLGKRFHSCYTFQPETLSRVLKRLVRNETVEIENGEVIITNKESLISIFKGVGI